MEFPDEDKFRQVNHGWQAHHGIEALVETTAQDKSAVKNAVPTTDYDLQDRKSIVESIRIRTRSHLRDTGGMGALLGLAAGAILGWWITISIESLQPLMLASIIGLGLTGLVSGVVIWRGTLSRITTRKYVKEALSKHKLPPAQLLQITKDVPSKYRGISRVLCKH